MPDRPRFTDRQWEAIGLLAKGLTEREIAVKWAVDRTVPGYHLREARKKMDCDTVFQMMNELGKRGLP